MDLASTNEIDQRWAHTGSRTECEVDDFAYADPIQRKLPDIRPYEARERTEQQLRQHSRQRRSADDPTTTNVVFVQVSRWRR
jgi:hypothetical protein